MIFLLAAVWIARKRRIDNREMNVQLEHLKNLWRGDAGADTFVGAGGGWKDGVEYQETVRDMTAWEKVRCRFGGRMEKSAFVAGFGGYDGYERRSGGGGGHVELQTAWVDPYRRDAVEAGWQGDASWAGRRPEKLP